MKEVRPKTVIAATAVRLTVLCASLISMAVVSRYIFREHGTETFAVASLVMSLQALFAFSDFGSGGALVNALKNQNAPRSEMVHGVSTAIRLACIVPGITSGGAATLWAIGTLKSGTAIAIIALAWGVPLGLGNKILIGIDRAVIAAATGIAGPIASLTLVLLLGPYISDELAVCIWPVASLASSILATTIASRQLIKEYGLSVPRLALRTRNRRANYASTARTSALMLIIAAATPIAYGSDRLILAWVSNLSEVAQYSLVAQLYLPATTVITTAAMSLWGAVHKPALLAPRRTIVVVGITGAAALVAVAQPYAKYVAGESADVSNFLVAGFALLLVLFSMATPVAMAFVSGERLVLHAKLIVAACIANVTLSAYLGVVIGATGPVAASILSLSLFQLLPMLVRERRASHA